MTETRSNIPAGAAETTYEAETADRYNQQNALVLELLKAHAESELRGMTPGSMSWAEFIVAQLPLKR